MDAEGKGINMDLLLNWEWDDKKKEMIAPSRYHSDGSPFFYRIKQVGTNVVLSADHELLPRSRCYRYLARAVAEANRIERE